MKWFQVTFLTLLLTSGIAVSSPKFTGHGEVHTLSGVSNPHADLSNITGATLNPKVTVATPHGPVRVETKNGVVFIPQIGPHGGRVADGRGDPYPRCLLCHEGIENITKNMMGLNLSCEFCHGGDPFGETIETAHIFSDGTVEYNETIPPRDRDLDYQKFVNPSNLRVVDQTCGMCHPEHVERVEKSLMATAAGHYAGGLYQNNVVDTKTPIYGTFAVSVSSQPS